MERTSNYWFIVKQRCGTRVTRLLRTWGVWSVLLMLPVQAQEPTVILNQGAVIGVKIFPESSRIPIEAFLGIPYAAPPIGRLRFSAPEKHKGWKRTLYAQDFGPPCLQSSLVNEPNSVEKQHSEDCLYLNIWAPEKGQRTEKLPVIIVFHSASFSGGSRTPILPGQDLAAEGLLVVSVAYRLGIFGFLCLAAPDARGNLGLLDQYFAMLWVRENIARFGGDPSAVTLMGHSAGATSIIYHMISPRTKALFSRAILMSGSITSIWTEANVTRSSKSTALTLGCFFDTPKEIVQCLRERSSDDIIKAINSQSQSGNWTDIMVPVVDNFLQKNDQYLPLSPKQALTSGNFHQIPVLIGITNMEATDSSEHWQDLARQGYHQLRHYVDHTAIPNVMALYKLNTSPNSKQIRELIKWEYTERTKDGDAWGLLQQLRSLYSDALYDAPHARLVSLLVKSTQPLYVYRYRQAGGVDLYGKKSNSSGAAHTSELPYLFGPTLFQQLTRRRLTAQEERLSKRMRVMWAEFVKFGYPTPPRQYDAWQAYTERDSHIQQLGEGLASAGGRPSYWNTFLPRFSNLSMEREPRNIINDMRVEYDGNDTIRHAMYTLLGLVVALVILLVVCVVLLKRSSKERKLSRDFGTF